MLRLKSVLVTGSEGFVGRYLVDSLLDTGCKVVRLDQVAVGRQVAMGSRKAAPYVSGHIEDRSTIESVFKEHRFDSVFHLAGLHGQTAPVDLYRTNIIGTQIILETIARLSPSTTVILQGSSAMYGGCTDRQALTEDSPLNPETPYGISKLAADQIGLTFFRERGLHVLRSRPFNIIGPGQSSAFLCSSVAEKLVAIETGQQPPVLKLGNLTTSRDFIDVRDVIRGLIGIAANGAAGEAYNLCSGQATLVDDIVKTLISLIRLEVQVEAGVLPGTNVSYQRGSFFKLAALGWRPEYSLERSLGDIVEYWRNRYKIMEAHGS